MESLSLSQEDVPNENLATVPNVLPAEKDDMKYDKKSWDRILK